MTFRDVVAGISLANLVLIRAWFLAGSRAYFVGSLPLERAYAGLVIDFCLLAALIAGLSAWSRRGARALSASALIVSLLLLVPFDWLLRHGTGVVLSDLASRWGTTIGALGMAVVLLVIVSVRWLQLALVRVLPIVALPIVLVTVPYAFMPFVARPLTPAPVPDAPMPADGARVLWLLFDSLSHPALTGGLPLPAFTRLMSESFVATEATSPAGRTLLSVPAMSIGRPVTTATPRGYDLALGFADGGQGDWSRQETVFRAVRGMGYDSQAVGWYHPYCDVLIGHFDRCEWLPMDPPANRVAAGMQQHAQEAIGALSLLVREGLHDLLLTDAQVRARREQHVQTLRAIAGRGAELASEMSPGLTYVHYPVPHPPEIGELFEPGGGAQWSGYEGNVVVADRTLADLRARLEGEGVWEDMAIVVTSDHVWPAVPSEPGNVPFIVKLPGTHEPFTYTAPVSLLVLRDLLPRLVSREIGTPEQLATYLSARP